MVELQELFRYSRYEWIKYLSIQKNPVEDGCMRYRDDNLTFIGSFAGNFDVVWGY